MKSRNDYRILAGALIGIIVWTAFWIAIPRIPLATIGYAFGLVSLVILACLLLRCSSAGQGNAVVRASFPLQGWIHLVISTSLTVLVVGLALFGSWTMPSVLFVALHLLLLGRLGWIWLAMSAGSEEISRVSRVTSDRCAIWRALTDKVENILLKVKDEDMRTGIKAVYEAMRYADPAAGGDESQASLVAEIEKAIDELDIIVSDSRDVGECCSSLLQLVKRRNAACIKRKQ